MDIVDIIVSSIMNIAAIVKVRLLGNSISYVACDDMHVNWTGVIYRCAIKE